jgi:hypothetical protein
MNIVFFKRDKPRHFEYRPRYYDPGKAEMEERRRQLGLDPEDPHSQFRSAMRRSWRRPKPAQFTRMTVIRVMIYAFLAVLLIYYIFFTDLINNLLSFLLE